MIKHPAIQELRAIITKHGILMSMIVFISLIIFAFLICCQC